MALPSQELALEDADIWFIRGSMDARCRVLACGSRTGRVFLWDTDAVTPHAKFKVKRPPGKDNTVSVWESHCTTSIQHPS